MSLLFGLDLKISTISLSSAAFLVSEPERKTASHIGPLFGTQNKNHSLVFEHNIKHSKAKLYKVHNIQASVY